MLIITLTYRKASCYDASIQEMQQQDEKRA